MLPKDAVEFVRQWANDKTPEEFRDRMRVEVDENPRALTIVECSFMAGLDGETRWLRVPSASLVDPDDQASGPVAASVRYRLHPKEVLR